MKQDDQTGTCTNIFKLKIQGTQSQKHFNSKLTNPLISQTAGIGDFFRYAKPS